MNKKLEEIFNTANAEFWLQINDGISENFGEMVMAYLKSLDKKETAFVIKDYKLWKENHMEAK